MKPFYALAESIRVNGDRKRAVAPCVGTVGASWLHEWRQEEDDQIGTQQ